MESFTQLEVWQKAHALVLKIYEVTKEFPNDERFRLADQLCWSAASVPANIAEGKVRNTRKEYIQCSRFARRNEISLIIGQGSTLYEWY